MEWNGGQPCLTPRTLQQRLSFFVLLPVAVLLLSMGAAGFFYARTKLLDQWGEAAMLRLQRAAHQVDMRLDMPKIWLDLYQRTSKSHMRDGFKTTSLNSSRRWKGSAALS